MLYTWRSRTVSDNLELGWAKRLGRGPPRGGTRAMLTHSGTLTVTQPWMQRFVGGFGRKNGLCFREISFEGLESEPTQWTHDSFHTKG